MNRRRVLISLLVVLALFLVGTVIVLSSVTYYLAINPSAYLTELEVPLLRANERWNASEHDQVERIPRILHQTWRSETLPDRWQPISQECRDMMPDYEYILWTDDMSRDFIAKHYPWFSSTFANYKYPIQRADAIRYFVLYHYGGVYLDLDVGCLKPVDPLLVYPVILPKTIPVGVSNDLMFAEKGHPFLAQTIHNLVTFDLNWILNYPTVMFSTGPMFLSAQYGIYTSSHPTDEPLRILPKSLYGKNAKEGEAPHSFFSHFYGSSWHADDAAFIGFLGHWGKMLMVVGLIVLIFGLVRMMWPRKNRRYIRLMGGDVAFPRLSRSGRWHLHLGRPSMSLGTSSPEAEVPVLHFDMTRPTSPASSDTSSSTEPFAGRVTTPIVDAFRRVRNRISTTMAPGPTQPDEYPRTPVRPRRRQNRGVLFFLPAIFTPTPDIELGSASTSYSRVPNPTHLQGAPRGPEKPRYPDLDDLVESSDLEDAGLDAVSHSRGSSSNSGSTLIDVHDEHHARTLNSSSRSRSTSHARAS